jgi:hypothetical protein
LNVQCSQNPAYIHPGVHVHGGKLSTSRGCSVTLV